MSQVNCSNAEESELEEAAWETFCWQQQRLGGPRVSQLGRFGMTQRPLLKLHDLDSDLWSES